MNGYILNVPKAKIARLVKLFESIYKQLTETCIPWSQSKLVVWTPLWLDMLNKYFIAQIAEKTFILHW